MRTRTSLLLLGILLFLSCCRNPTYYEESNYVFKIPQKEIYVRTSKRFGAKFVVFFAKDSLSLKNSKDSIEFKTGEIPLHIVLDTTNIYLEIQHAQALKNINNEYVLQNETILPPIRQMGSSKFNIKLIPDTIFRRFFNGYKIIPPYSSIHIYTKTYSIVVNQQEIRAGSIHGGW